MSGVSTQTISCCARWFSVSPTFFLSLLPRPPPSTLFPYTTLFRSSRAISSPETLPRAGSSSWMSSAPAAASALSSTSPRGRSEEHTSELQSRGHLVCRLLLEKKKKPHKTLDIPRNHPYLGHVGLSI